MTSGFSTRYFLVFALPPALVACGAGGETMHLNLFDPMANAVSNGSGLVHLAGTFTLSLVPRSNSTAEHEIALTEFALMGRDDNGVLGRIAPDTRIDDGIFPIRRPQNRGLSQQVHFTATGSGPPDELAWMCARGSQGTPVMLHLKLLDQTAESVMIASTYAYQDEGFSFHPPAVAFTRPAPVGPPFESLTLIHDEAPPASTIEVAGVAKSGGIVVSGMVSAPVAGVHPRASGEPDLLLARLEPSSIQWDRGGIGPGFHRSAGIDVDAAGAVVTAGYFEGPIQLAGVALEGGERSIYLLRLSFEGDPIVVRALPAPSQSEIDGTCSDESLFVADGGSGTTILAGPLYGSIDLGGVTLPSPMGQCGSDVFVVKFGSAGEVLWHQVFGGTGVDRVTGLGADGAGNVYLAGYTYGTIDFGTGAIVAQGTDPFQSAGRLFVAGLDAQGNVTFARGVGDSAIQPGDGPGEMRIAGRSTGAVVAASFDGHIDLGPGSSPSQNGHSAFAASLSPTGDVIWSRLFSGEGRIDSVAVGPDGRVVLGGQTRLAFDLGGPAPLMGLPQGVGFVAVLDPTGGHRMSRTLFCEPGSVHVGASNGEITVAAGVHGYADEHDGRTRYQHTSLWVARLRDE